MLPASPRLPSGPTKGTAVLIIMGTKIRTKVLRALVFACPSCRTDRDGVLLGLRRWFTIFFLPVVPMGQAGEVVRCDTCGSTFDPAVLDQPTGATLAEVHDAAVRVLTALLVGAGDRGDGALRQRAVASIGSVVPGYDDATLAADLQALDPAQAPQYVLPLAGALDQGAKERFLGELARVATAGGVPTAGQRQLLDEIGQTLGLTPAHVAGIVATSTPGGTA